MSKPAYNTLSYEIGDEVFYMRKDTLTRAVVRDTDSVGNIYVIWGYPTDEGRNVVAEWINSRLAFPTVSKLMTYLRSAINNPFANKFGIFEI